MRTADSLEKFLMLGKIEDRRKRGCQRMRWLDGIINAMDMNLSKLLVLVEDSVAYHTLLLLLLSRFSCVRLCATP